MEAYVYRWSLRPEDGFALELRVTAPSVVAARRKIDRFLVEHDGGTWVVDCVSRETTVHSPLPPLPLPPEMSQPEVPA